MKQEKSAEAQNWQYCEECNTPLSACGEQNPDGTPSMDCLVCQLREQLDKTRDRMDAALAEVAAMKRGEYICGKCGLRQSPPESSEPLF